MIVTMLNVHFIMIDILGQYVHVITFFVFVFIFCNKMCHVLMRQHVI